MKKTPILQPVRGTSDILPKDMVGFRAIIDNAKIVAENYGFLEMATPIFENTSVFVKTIGETTDVVSKEMYSFDDRGGDNITLRPEGTAGIARSFISNGLGQDIPFKVFYNGAMFRYERPQKGRYRQFHQIGVELIGTASPLADIEVISCAAAVLDKIGVLHKTKLLLNSLGDMESRLNYRQKLIDYFSKYKNELSNDSQTRLEKNPLRILDSKNENDKRISIDAPNYIDSLNENSIKHIEMVKLGLNNLNIDFTYDQKLVRGLDYYCHTAFEFVTDELGAQGTVLGGGRYDGLIAKMKNSSITDGTSAIGWAGGIERLMLLSDKVKQPLRPIYILPFSNNDNLKMLEVAKLVRQAGYKAEFGFSGNLGKRLKKATNNLAKLAIIVGGDEWEAGKVQIKDLDKSEQSTINITDIVGFIVKKY